MLINNAKYSRASFALTITALSTIILIPNSYGESFIDESSLTGGLYYWQRDRDRKELDPNSENYKKYSANLQHSTFNASLDFSSGYFIDVIGLDLAAFSAVELSNSGPAAPNELGFSDGKTRWDEKVGEVFDFDAKGELSMSYMWSDHYKAPWYRDTYNFREADGETGISYLHAIGFKYDFKNNLLLEASYGQAKDYMDQYFAKVSYPAPIAQSDLRLSYQFYGAKDKVSDGGINDVYDGLAFYKL